MKRHRKYLFLRSGHEGQGKMFTINTLGLSLFFLFLVVSSAVGIWSLITGTFFVVPSRNRVENVRTVQGQIKSKFEQIKDKQVFLQEQVSEISEELTPQLPVRQYWGPNSVEDEETFRSYSLDEFVAKSSQLVDMVSDLTVDVKDKNSVWYTIPLLAPVASTTPVFLKNLYGMIEDPLSGEVKMHHGIDFSAVKGSPVLAAGNGKVSKIENTTFAGRRIVIRHSFGYTSTYAHLNSIDVKKGDKVLKGDQIGTVGETGWSSSPLVHFEVRKEGKSFDPKILLGPSVHR